MGDYVGRELTLTTQPLVLARLLILIFKTGSVEGGSVVGVIAINNLFQTDLVCIFRISGRHAKRVSCTLYQSALLGMISFPNPSTYGKGNCKNHRVMREVEFQGCMARCCDRGSAIRWSQPLSRLSSRLTLSQVCVPSRKKPPGFQTSRDSMLSHVAQLYHYWQADRAKGTR